MGVPSPAITFERCEVATCADGEKVSSDIMKEDIEALVRQMKAAPPYHGLTALGMTTGLESLQSHYSHGG